MHHNSQKVGKLNVIYLVVGISGLVPVVGKYFKDMHGYIL